MSHARVERSMYGRRLLAEEGGARLVRITQAIQDRAQSLLLLYEMTGDPDAARHVCDMIERLLDLWERSRAVP